MLHFQPIDLARHFDLCLAFRHETHLASFGTDHRFWGYAGKDGSGYRAWLIQRMTDYPDACVHAFIGSTITGQIEMGLDRDVADATYVNLFYLVPDARGRGLAEELYGYARRWALMHGCARLRLTVGRDNARAIAVYRRWGFSDLGPRQDEPMVSLMERAIDR